MGGVQYAIDRELKLINIKILNFTIMADDV
jgi:hypothetical protein